VEYPGDWDLLTASLSFCDLKEPYEAWSFLVLQDLVRDRPGDREAFVKVVEATLRREPIPGPSGALVIAGELMRTGAATNKAAARDPFGKMAEKRRQQVEGWKRASPSGQNQGQSRWKFWRREG
jgi:hypothetical protein